MAKAKAAKKPKPAPRALWLSRQLVEMPIHYILLLSPEALHQELRRLKVAPHDWPPFLIEGSRACVTFLDDGAGKQVALVRLGEHEGLMACQVYALLVHEGVHIYQRYIRRIGERNPGDEFEAYSIQRIAQELIHSYHQQTGKTP